MNSFDGMDTFVKVVEEGGFTAAAAVMRTSKSTASETVRALETRLGVRLLDRTTRRLAPTEAGRLFYARCKRALAEAEAAVAEAQALQAEPVGRLRVATTETFSRLYLMASAASFLADHPSMEIELVEAVRPADLIAEGLDLAIRIAEHPAPNLIVRRIATSEVVIVAAPAYLAAKGAPASPEEVAHHDCVGFTPLHWGHEWRFIGAGDMQAVPVKPRLLTNSTETLRAAALAGVGLVALPNWAVADQLAGGGLMRVLNDWKTPQSGIYAVYPSNRLLTPKVKRFVDRVAGDLRARGLT